METAPQYILSKPDTQPITVYLAGSIDAHATPDAATAWREEAAEVLTAAGYRVLNPLRWPADSYDDSAEIMRRNLVDLVASDIILTEMDNPGLAYIGTAIEIYQAWQLGKEIILWGRANRRSHALRYYAPLRYETLSDALNYLVLKKRGVVSNVR